MPLVVHSLIAAVLSLLSVVVPSTATAPERAVPASCASNGAYVWANLALCGWPAKTTTGPLLAKCPQGLTPMGTDPRSTIVLSRAGQQLTCRAITGCVSITGTGVLLSDVTIRCTSGRTGEEANGTGVVKVENGASATIQRARLDGLKGNHACVWHEGRSVQIAKIDCTGVNDGVFSWTAGGGDGNNLRLRDSYFHDFTIKTANGHVDGYQTEGAAHGVIRHNTWLMTTDAPGGDNDSNSAIAIWDGMSDSTDYLVNRNLIAGGGFAIYAHDYSPSEQSPGGGYSVTDVRFRDNVFSTKLFPCVGYYGVWFPRGAPTDGWTRTGNRVLETGQSLDAGNPTANGQPCT